MRKFMAGVVVGAVLGGAYTTLAAQSKRTLTVYGGGAVSCGVWVEQIQDRGARLPLIGWVQGFVSGVVWTQVATLKETDNAAMQLFVTNYCNAHPIDDVLDAGAALVRALIQK